MKYRKKPVVIEAIQWFKNGDHPKDDCYRPFEDSSLIPNEQREGKIVRYFRDPFRDPWFSGSAICKHCNYTYHEHGWIETLEGGHRVCVGDWIIEGIKGEFYPCKPDIFEMTYERVEE